jgi:DNA (cytosine-5)-methyltransferase 1
MLTAGSLFAGYGGIELALSSVLDVRPAWFVEFDKAPSKVLTHHWPDVPNYGDVTTVDWSTVPPVDIITGGSPCQDLSHAGKRAGMTEGTRSNLWVQMREAINVIRPRLVVWENVRGAFSAPADSALEPCPGCVGDGDDGPVLRALGRVLGDLADLGYDCRWYGLRAADVGAAHGRFRVFLAAVPADADDQGLQGLADQARTASTGRHGHPVAGVGGSSLTLLPTPKASNNENRSSGWANGPNLGEALALLPTPRATDGTKGGPNQRGSSGDLMLPSAVTLLPTPAVNDMARPSTSGTLGPTA